jgi:Zn-dependent metalloprotease
LRTALALASVTLLVSSGLAVTATSVSATPSGSLLAAADAALKKNAKAVKGSAQDRYAVYSSKKDSHGDGVVRYTRTYRGLRVYGGDFILRVGADGHLTGSSVGLTAPLSVGITPAVSAAKAQASAKAAFSGKVTARPRRGCTSSSTRRAVR